ncbi:hypothetical protein [Staphylococcus phage APTC_SA_12]|nr:MAG: hypothetical protein [Staphylococcus phage RP2]UPO38619.1 hypothetical protein [Staphylococcus phage vB_SaS_GE1]UWV19982.1 hypothetical protein [Staphylococcus phage APTC_SA_2]UWV20144.1 hypothetical protein [Staphylococcus phage APTC_SA_4]UWV20315.1 hypothetical protein [Staphylococcus phage APTC_SA_12]UWV20566.1 hypothetical protein [Staphylococcus phage APTC_SA_13]WMT38683.1 hypothetical protein [Staphylococcus phage Sp2021]WPH67233.1 hypothetical protein CUBM_gp74 [Staphylococcus
MYYLYINYNIIFITCQVNFKKIIEVGTFTYFYLIYTRMITLLLFYTGKQCNKNSDV